MTDINTNNSSSTTKEAIKSKKELKQEERDKKFALKAEAQRVKKISKLEAKKAKYESTLKTIQSPWRKGTIQKRVDTLDAKIKDLKENKSSKRPFKLVMKTWSKGLGKEAKRITWHDKRSIVKDFVTVILVCVFLAVIFFAIDMIIISMR